VEVDDVWLNRLEKRGGGDLVVDQDAATTKADDLPTDQQTILELLDPRLSQQLKEGLISLDIEEPLNHRPVGTGTNHFDGRARPLEQTQRIDNDRLPLSRLAANQVQTGMKFGLEAVDQSQIGYDKVSEHITPTVQARRI